MDILIESAGSQLEIDLVIAVSTFKCCLLKTAWSLPQTEASELNDTQLKRIQLSWNLHHVGKVAFARRLSSEGSCEPRLSCSVGHLETHDVQG